MTRAPDPDPAAVLRTLGLPDAVGTQRMAGADAAVWRADLEDGRTVAVRVLRPGRNAKRELDALRLASDHHQPAPDVVCSGRVNGRDVVVTSWCPGRPIGAALVEGGAADTLGQIFGRAHAELHRPLADGAVLCHLDFQPFNVLTDGAVVTGIVDWANARVGDPREDIAWTTVVLALAPALLPGHAERIDRFTQAWRAGYAAVRPLPSEADLEPYLAVAARAQHGDWAPRAAAGECSSAVLDLATALTTRWSEA